MVFLLFIQIIYNGKIKFNTQAIDGGLVKRDGTWNLVFTDFKQKNFRYNSGEYVEGLNSSVTILKMNDEVCCRLIKDVPCVCPPETKVPSIKAKLHNRKNIFFGNKISFKNF